MNNTKTIHLNCITDDRTEIGPQASSTGLAKNDAAHPSTQNDNNTELIESNESSAAGTSAQVTNTANVSRTVNDGIYFEQKFKIHNRTYSMV